MAQGSDHPGGIREGGADRVSVLLPVPLAGPLDYRVPPGTAVTAGDVVMVPLHGRTMHGVVWDSAPDPSLPFARLKPLAPAPGLPRLAPALRRLIDWVAAYTLSAPGEVLAMVIRAPLLVALPQTLATGWLPGEPPPPAGLTPARRRLLDVLVDGRPRALADLIREAGVGSGVARAMADRGWLRPVTMARAEAFERPDPDHAGAATLSAQQAEAGRSLVEGVRAQAFAVTLLDGVTGSGKTEVYLEAVAECLRLGRQALVLLPEIALSAQWLERFERRFGVAPAVWHSDLTPATRRTHLAGGGERQAPVVVGARSALFLPFPDLGLIVVDEEHETAFKQEEGVVYHARDMAVVRARLESRAGRAGLRDAEPGDGGQCGGRAGTAG